MNIGERIKYRREELGLTQEQLAYRLGYKSKSTINKIEMGINDVAQKKIIAFATALECTTAFLMGWDNEKPSLSPAATPALSPDREELLANYDNLNEEGQQKVREYAADLIDSGKYEKESGSITA